MKKKRENPMACRYSAPPTTVKEAIEIAQAEFEYWRKSKKDLAITGMGAAANICVALQGWRAPWHPKAKVKKKGKK